MSDQIISAIPHIPAGKFSLPDPWLLGNSLEDDETGMVAKQEWFDRHAPETFQVVAVDHGDGEKSLTMYYLISKAEFESLGARDRGLVTAKKENLCLSHS